MEEAEQPETSGYTSAEKTGAVVGLCMLLVFAVIAADILLDGRLIGGQ